jgi:tetratricopeptide (TPR) repeat protein
VSATPSRGSRPLDDNEMVALARTMPDPTLSEACREEMRTAFLSSVRGLRSGAGVRTLAFTRRRRIVLIAALLSLGGGAAAAWRIGKTVHRAPRPLPHRVTSPDLSTHAPQVATPATSFPEPGRPLPESRPRRLSLAPRGHSDDRGTESDLEISFARGWSALRTSDFDRAAAEFARAGSGPRNALTEDAVFWRGVALDRAGRFAPARTVLEAFLARYPDSERKGEASVILGWLLIRSEDFGEARGYFERSLLDPAEPVRRSARSGFVAAESRVPRPLTPSDGQP